ncbi:MAG: hypothetical protein Q8O95_03740 [bacterium]|nr:hypothetical protein [bacterium]
MLTACDTPPDVEEKGEDSMMDEDEDGDGGAIDRSGDAMMEGTGFTRRYGVESGMVSYTLSGVQVGTKTIYWDHWGMREATYKDSEIQAGGVTVPSREVSIMDGDWLVTYNPDTKTGSRIKNTILDQIAKNTGKDDLGEVGLQMLQSMGGIKTGADIVAGKTCDVYDVVNLATTTCVWNAVTLKSQSNMMGMSISETATEVFEGPVDVSRFVVPDDIKIQDMGDLEEMMKGIKGM